MFLGEFEYRVDEKGRASIPPKFRVELKDGVVLTLGVEKCITAYPMAEWKNLAKTVTTSSVAPNKIRRLHRALFATAFSTKMDNQGRIILPQSLRAHAEIEDELVIIGANNYFEFWNKEQWAAEKAICQEQIWQITESLERE